MADRHCNPICLVISKGRAIHSSVLGRNNPPSSFLKFKPFNKISFNTKNSKGTFEEQKWNCFRSLSIFWILLVAFIEWKIRRFQFPYKMSDILV